MTRETSTTSQNLRVGIVGTGAYAQALGTRLARVGIEVVFGSRRAEGDACNSTCPMFLQGLPIKSPCEAVREADIVVLAIPMEVHSEMAHCLKDVIGARRVVLIDVSNASLSPSQERKIKQYSNPPPYSQEQHNEEKPKRNCKGCSNICTEHAKPKVVDIESLVLEKSPNSCPSDPLLQPKPTENPQQEQHEDMREISHAERLQEMMPGVRVVKAFNTVSAYVLKEQAGKPFDDRVLVCGDDIDAKALVFRLIHSIGMRPVDAGLLAAARDIEKRPLEFFQEWQVAFRISMVFLLLAFVYVAVREVILSPFGKWRDLLWLKWNIILGWHAILLMTCTFGGGVAAFIRQLTTGTMKRAFPRWLDGWLRARKALGLFGLLSIAAHLVVACLTDHLFTDFYFVESWQGNFYQASMLLALLSTMTYTALGLTSLPSVSSRMSWREWTFMQSKMGHVGLAFGACHVLFMGFALGDLPPHVSEWTHYLPPVSYIAVIPAATVLILRLLIATPLISKRLESIRGDSPKSKKPLSPVIN